MRKLHISIIISLLLLLVQQGAVLHEMSHIVREGAAASALGASVQADNSLDKTCALCLAFSQVANPAGNTVSTALFEPSSCAAGSNPFCSITPADVLNPRSRGPPSSALNS
jgi:hypothetical protein